MLRTVISGVIAGLIVTSAGAQAPGTRVNYSNTTPAPPGGALNVQWQQDGGRPTINASAYVQFPTVQVICPTTGDLSNPVANALGLLPANQGGIVDARRCTGATAWTTAVTVSTPNSLILLPCATLAASQAVTIPAGIRNVAIAGCAYQGASTASGSIGGTVWQWNGFGSAFLIGDPTYAVDTSGFRIDNLDILTTGATGAATALYFYRTQEIRADNLTIQGPSTTASVGIVLDGTGNYSGGAFVNDRLQGFYASIVLTGDKTGAGIDDYGNASTFVKMHINCPESGGNPITGTFGIDIQGGDGNTIIGGDVEGCDVMLHLGAKAINNTIVGLRNEVSNTQFKADSGSAENSVVTGGTIFTGSLIDNGEHNSFADAFHRTFNGITGDWYASQQDATVTNHFRLGTGTGNERGLQNEFQTDYGNRWEVGISDGTSGQQFYQVQDLINNVQRLSIGQFLSASSHVVTNVILNNNGCFTSSTPPTISFTGGGGSGAAGTAVMAASSCSGGWQVLSVTMTAGGSGYTSQPTVSWSGSNIVSTPHSVAEIINTGGTNNQTAIASAGTGAVVINGSGNSGTGGLVVGSGGASPTTIYLVGNDGTVSEFGNLVFTSGATQTYLWECANLTGCTLQNANATTPARVFKANVNGQTELDSEGTTAVVLNNTTTGGTGGFIVYEGGANSGTAAFTVSGTGATSQPSNSQIGSASGTGNAVIGNHLNQLATGDFAGHCTMTSANSCGINFQHSWSNTPACGVSAQFALAGRVYYTYASATVTIHSTSTETGTFAAICAGDPN